MKLETYNVSGLEAGIIGMRNPMRSWNKSDSYFGIIDNQEEYWAAVNRIADTYKETTNYDRINWLNKNGVIGKSQTSEAVEVALIGANDLDLAQRLLGTGSDSDSKFLRYVSVNAQISAPMYFWSELETYKVGTTTNSTSVQHQGAKQDYTLDDFTLDDFLTYVNDDNNIQISSKKDLQAILDIVNKYRALYKNTHDYKYFRIMRQLLPAGLNYTKMWSCNYQVLRTIYQQRIQRPHRLKEWTEDFASWIKSLPYAKDLIMFDNGADR